MPTIRINYTYQNFEHCPKATEISKKRESFKSRMEYLGGLGVLLGFICLFTDLLYGILLLVSSVALIIYMNSHYKKETVKKIIKALEEQNSSQQVFHNTNL